MPAPMFERYSRPAGLVLCRIPAHVVQLSNGPWTVVDPHFAVKAPSHIMNSDGINIGLASLQRDAAAGRGLPPVERWNPAHCGDIDIRIAKDGTWFHQGTPFGRKELVRLFSTILRKDGEDFFLVTPAERMRIRVDDAPFVAVLLDVRGKGAEQNLVFTTNVGDEVVANAQNPIRVITESRTGEPAPYVHVRRGLEARISRTVYYQLADIAVPSANPDQLGIWSGGSFFILGSAT